MRWSPERGGSGDADYAHGELDQTSRGCLGATLLAPRGAQARPHCFLRVSNCLFSFMVDSTLCTRGHCCYFPLESDCGLNRQWSWVLAPASEPAGAHTPSRRSRSMRAQPEPPLSEGYNALSLLDCVSCIGATSRGKPVMGTVASNQRETGYRYGEDRRQLPPNGIHVRFAGNLKHRHCLSSLDRGGNPSKGKQERHSKHILPVTAMTATTTARPMWQSLSQHIFPRPLSRG
jgi:hypothetical protein